MHFRLPAGGDHGRSLALHSDNGSGYVRPYNNNYRTFYIIYGQNITYISPDSWTHACTFIYISVNGGKGTCIPFSALSALMYECVRVHTAGWTKTYLRKLCYKLSCKNHMSILLLQALRQNYISNLNNRCGTA